MPSKNNSDSMTSKLIQFFVLRTKGHITKTQLVKFLYLADLYAVKWHGKQITELEWYYYNHGPWESEIEVNLSQLKQQGLVREQNTGKNTTLIQIGTHDISEEALELPQSMKYMLENIRREWAGTSVDDLLDYVYKTAPMKDILDRGVAPEKRESLDLSKERELLLEELEV